MSPTHTIGPYQREQVTDMSPAHTIGPTSVSK